MNKKVQAFTDGVITGTDLIGTVLGHITKNPLFLGYTADQHSLKNFEEVVNTLEHNLHLKRLSNKYVPSWIQNKVDYKEIPILKRSIDEQILKGVGDVTGLVFNIVGYGIPLMYCLAAESVSQINHGIKPQQHYFLSH